tara:strand:- start:18 stop:248 length:231 start_codon:yes stop_codon:yes gene_type:complete
MENITTLINYIQVGELFVDAKPTSMGFRVSMDAGPGNCMNVTHAGSTATEVAEYVSANYEEFYPKCKKLATVLFNY